MNKGFFLLFLLSSLIGFANAKTLGIGDTFAAAKLTQKEVNQLIPTLSSLRIYIPDSWDNLPSPLLADGLFQILCMCRQRPQGSFRRHIGSALSPEDPHSGSLHGHPLAIIRPSCTVSPD